MAPIQSTKVLNSFGVSLKYNFYSFSVTLTKDALSSVECGGQLHCVVALLFLMGQPGLFFIDFRLSKHTLQFLVQINVKKDQPVYSAGIQNHDIWNMSLLHIH